MTARGDASPHLAAPKDPRREPSTVSNASPEYT
jgi:hypothetical protein